MIHQVSESEPDFVVGVAVGGDEERVAGNGSGYFSAAGESEFAVEFASVVEGENLFGLFREEFFGFREESEGGVAVEEGLELGDFVGVGRDGSGAGRIGFGALGFVLFRCFGYEERGGERAWVWEFRVRV